ncbi:MAG: hypothetical protein ABL869_14375, partial [Candidatus Nitrotoga sp.]
PACKSLWVSVPFQSSVSSFYRNVGLHFFQLTSPKAVVGAVMRKLAHLIYGVIKSGQPFDISFASRNLDFQYGI